MKDKDFEKLLEGVKQAGSYLRGEAVAANVIDSELPPTKTIRQILGKSQKDFAAMLDVSVGTLRNWEQGRRAPSGPARVLLKTVYKHPEIFSSTSIKNKTSSLECAPATYFENTIPMDFPTTNMLKLKSAYQHCPES